MSLPPAFLERDHSVSGLFVKEASPAAPGGPGTPLLFIHGAMHGWWSWKPWLALFAGFGWRCFALSLRNHPGSRRVPDEEFFRLDAFSYIEDILTVARWLPRPAVLIGHSMGSVLAQKAAESLQPAGLVMMCGAGPGQLGRLRDPMPLDQPLFRPAADVRRLFFSHIGDEAFRTYYEQLVPESPGVVNHCNDGTLTVDPARVTCPTLVVAGEADKVPLHPPARIAEFYGSDLLTVAGGSHNFMLEAPSLPAAIRLNQWLLQRVDDVDLPRLNGVRPCI